MRSSTGCTGRASPSPTARSTAMSATYAPSSRLRERPTWSTHARAWAIASEAVRAHDRPIEGRRETPLAAAGPAHDPARHVHPGRDLTRLRRFVPTRLREHARPPDRE